MRPAVLQLDDALKPQKRLWEAARQQDGWRLDARGLGARMRLWSRAATLAALKDRLAEAPAGGPAEVVFAGSGDFHHVTPLLLERAIARFGGPVTVIHFDNHPDWVRHAPGRHCGSWVGVAARLPEVAQVITVGVCSDDVGRRRRAAGDLALIEEERLSVFAWAAPDGGEVLEFGSRAWPTIEAMGEQAFLRHLDAVIATSKVYVTIDKDVLSADDAITNWDQGRASLDFLLAAIARVGQGRQVIGADVVGDWSRPIYQGDIASVLLRRAEALIDQPRRPPPACVLTVNETANLRLLAAFQALSS